MPWKRRSNAEFWRWEKSRPAAATKDCPEFTLQRALVRSKLKLGLRTVARQLTHVGHFGNLPVFGLITPALDGANEKQIGKSTNQIENRSH
jgi:hypothetical protein